MIFNSCQKETLLDNEITNSFKEEVNKLPVSVDANTLVFETEEDFQTTLDFLNEADAQMLNNFEQTLGYKSFRTAHPNLIGTENKYEDELFLSMINPNAEIIIAKHLMKVDFETEKTLVIPVDENNTRLKSATTLNFDWDDDVFEYLENGNSNSFKSKYCGGAKVKDRSWEFNKGDVYNYAHLRIKISFSRYGFYNAILIQFKAKQLVGNFKIYGSYKTEGSNYYKPRKKNKTSFSKQRSRTFTGTGQTIYDRPYNRTRRLVDYNVNVRFYYKVTQDAGAIPPSYKKTDEKVLNLHCK